MNLLEEKRKIETELHQLQNRQKILLNKKANAERKARTHRLIERGAILESVFPAVAAMTGELDREAQLALVRAYVRDNFVAAGMCADFALHDKGDGNPHAHIMLTMRPLEQSSEWGAKCRKEYDLDPRGQRIPDGKGGWKNHRADTTDWNEKDKAEQWRAAWAEYANRALEQSGRPERIDHRSYKRQGVEQLPTVHMGVAATRMERRGIATDKGSVNRQIAADNKLLKEIKARITRLYNWTKEKAEGPQGKESVMAQHGRPGRK